MKAEKKLKIVEKENKKLKNNLELSKLNIISDDLYGLNDNDE